MKLDLSYKGKLDSEITVLYNNIAKHLRGPFTQVVSEISEPMKCNLDWWVEGPASERSAKAAARRCGHPAAGRGEVAGSGRRHRPR